MENQAELVRRILNDPRYFEEFESCVILSGVFFDQHQRCIKNTYHKCIVFQRENQIFSIQGYNQIGKTPVGLERVDHDGLEECHQSIDVKARELGFHKTEVKYVDARHLVWRQPESRLTQNVFNLLMRLLDEYMPIGILDIDEISEAEEILDSIEKSLQENEHVDVKLSKEFYECIPHNDFAVPIEVIKDRNTYENKRDALIRLRSALEKIHESLQVEVFNPIDYLMRNWLCTDLMEVNRADVEFSQLKWCIQETQHDRFFKLANAFKVTPPADIPFKNGISNQCLLYHFVFPCEILSILRDGLQVSSNRYQRDGFYFWDSASLALDKFKDELYRKMPPVLLVCRVARGAVKNEDFATSSLSPLSKDKNSFFWRGKEYADVTSATADFVDAKMYCGEVERFDGRVTNDLNDYNVYMVESRDQVKIEYILQFERDGE